MIDKLKSRIRDYLQEHEVCVISVSEAPCNWLMPVPYRADGLKLHCLVPNWADLAYYLEQNPTQMVLVVIHHKDQVGGISAGCWLQYLAVARAKSASEWHSWQDSLTENHLSADLYKFFELTPLRIDLIDGRRGWGIRETLDLTV